MWGTPVGTVVILACLGHGTGPMWGQWEVNYSVEMMVMLKLQYNLQNIIIDL